MSAKFTWIIMAFLGLQTIAFAQQPTSGNKSLIKEKFHFKLPGNQDTEGGYTQAIRVGNTIYVSGTVTLDKNEKGVDHVYKVISKTLEHYGAGLQHVVKEGLYTTDIETMKSLNHVRKKWYKGDYPTSTWLQVSRLYMSEAWLEIEVTAILPE